MLKCFVLLLCLFVLAAAARPAAAHTELTQSDPAPGAQLAESPGEIRLTFSEPAGAQSQIVLLADGFQPVEGVAARMDSPHPEQVFAPLPPLAPGNYTVQWSAVSEDGHEISGSYSFSVAETAAASPGLLASLSDQWPWLLALLVLVAGAPLMIRAWRGRQQ
jgi:methionine-rich copper-binding protein CopC